MLVSEDDSLRRWVVYVYKDDRCTCEYDWRSLGHGYGKCWVRLTTSADCPHHAARLAGRGHER